MNKHAKLFCIFMFGMYAGVGGMYWTFTHTVDEVFCESFCIYDKYNCSGEATSELECKVMCLDTIEPHGMHHIMFKTARIADNDCANMDIFLRGK